MDTVKELEKRWWEARESSRKFSNMIDDACHEACKMATDAIKAKYEAAHGEKREKLRREEAEAERAYQDALIEKNLAKSPWPIGTVLVGWGRKKTHYFISENPLEPLAKGVVEIRKRDTVFPPNREHGIPQVGEVFVRLCKKSGKPGLGFFRIGINRDFQWLPEGEKPKGAK